MLDINININNNINIENSKIRKMSTNANVDITPKNGKTGERKEMDHPTSETPSHSNTTKPKGFVKVLYAILSRLLLFLASHN